MSQDACSGFQSDGWNCVCWNYPGNGLPEPSANGNPSYPCHVRSVNSYTWVQQGENSCKDRDGQVYNYCSKDMLSGTETMVECQAAVDTLDQVWIAGLGWQASSNGGGICVIHMMSQDACSGFQSDGWNCVCWNYPGNGLPEPSANGNPSYPCHVRSDEGCEERDRDTVACSTNACVALKNDATAVVWGEASQGGDASSVDLTNVAEVHCGGHACVARKKDGTAVAWGQSQYGGDASSVDLTNVVYAMCASQYVCVARKNDGTAVAWGHSSYGGDASNVDLTNVADIMCGGQGQCVARKNDGTAVAWGKGSVGGDASGVDLTNVAETMCGGHGCVARKNDGTVVAWGMTGYGGNAPQLTNVADVQCGMYACVARKNDGTAVVWGASSYGGSASGVDLTNVVDAMCGGSACVARKSDGTGVVWGHSERGGDASSVDLTDLADAMCANYACIARKNDGTVVVWGWDIYGQTDTSGVDLTNVAYAMCGYYACVARKNDGTAVVWGLSDKGGDASGVDLTNILDPSCPPAAAPAPTLVLDGSYCYSSGTPNGGNSGYKVLGNLLEESLESCAALVQAEDSSAMFFVYEAKYKNCFVHKEADKRRTICTEDSGEMGFHHNFDTYRIDQQGSSSGTCDTYTYVTDCTSRTYEDSVAYCADQGMVIASFHSDADVAQIGTEPTCSAYLGGESTGAGHEWIWRDGSSWTYTYSVNDGLDGLSSTRLVWKTDGLWHDHGHGSVGFGVICKSCSSTSSSSSSSSGRRVLESQQSDDYPVAKQYALRARLLRL